MHVITSNTKQRQGKWENIGWTTKTKWRKNIGRHDKKAETFVTREEWKTLMGNEGKKL